MLRLGWKVRISKNTALIEPPPAQLRLSLAWLSLIELMLRLCWGRGSKVAYQKSALYYAWKCLKSLCGVLVVVGG
jgi:hypothetical protein